MNSDHDTRAKRDQHGTNAQHDQQVWVDGGDALPSGELSQFDNTDALQSKESVVEQLRELSRKHDDALTESEQAALECAGKWVRSMDGFANVE